MVFEYGFCLFLEFLFFYFDLDGSIIDLWSARCMITISAQLTPLWRMAIISVFWSVWHIWNLFLFENQVPSIHHVLSIIWSSIREANGLSFGSMENQVDELAILHTLHIQDRPSRAPRIIEILWKPLPPGWIKVNTDGAAFGCPSLVGSGGIFLNRRGFVHGCFAIPIRLAFAFESKLVAAIQAISFAWDRNWRKLWLETDSMYLVHLFRSKSLVVP